MELNHSNSSANVERAELTLNRVGTCMVWQWMCPNHCGYVLGIDSSREHIIALAARHLDVCEGADVEHLVSTARADGYAAGWRDRHAQVDYGTSLTELSASR